MQAKPNDQPRIADVENDLGLTLYAIREYAVVRYSALFESFVQCWALNMLLAVLENDDTLTHSQLMLSKEFSPVGKSFVFIPGVRKILLAFPRVQGRLAALPHISTDPKTKEPVEVPSTTNLNALRTIEFWRDFRNHVVHRGTRISTGFSREHWEFFEDFRQPYGDLLRPLQYGKFLQLPDAIYYALATTHRKAAVFLNTLLQEVSGGHRGAIYAPDEANPEPTEFDPSVQPRPLLQPGDHEESLAFVDQFIYVPERDDDSAGDDA